MTTVSTPTAPDRPSGLRIWLLAIRPATLPAAVSGVVVGLGAAAAVRAPFRLDTALGCLAVALLLQVAANLANDLSDFRAGADTPDRTGPLRVAAAGLVSERQLEVAIGATVALAGLVGLWLAVVGGPVLLLLGALAIVAALAYTGGPWPYGYHGLGPEDTRWPLDKYQKYSEEDLMRGERPIVGPGGGRLAPLSVPAPGRFRKAWKRADRALTS